VRRYVPSGAADGPRVAMIVMSNIFLTTGLCLLLLSGCTNSEEKKISPFQPKTQRAGTQEETGVPYYQGLIEEYRADIAEDPNNLAMLVALGNAYYDSGDWRNAISAYERALKIDPDNRDVRTDMGTSYRNLGLPDRALAEYRYVLKHEPGHLNARFNMGVVFAYDKKNYPAAIQTWEEILKMAPNNPQAEFLKSNIAELKKGHPKAEK